MEATFNAKNVYQALVGAVSHPNRDKLLPKVANGLMSNSALAPSELQKGVNDALETGLITKEDANELFPGVINTTN